MRTSQGRYVEHVLPLRRLALAWLLAMSVATALGAVAAQASAREHACCPNATAEAQVPADRCESLLPLACCDASVLPVSARTAADPSELALPSTPASTAVAPLRAAPPVRPGALASRASPRGLSVVLQL